MNSNTNRTSARTRATPHAISLRTLAFLGASAALALPALAGRAGDQRAPIALEPEVIEVTPRVMVIGQPDGQSSYTFHSNDNGRVVHIEIVDGTVVKAEIDGAAIPDDRIERDGDLVKLKGPDGGVLFEHRVPKPDVSTLGSPADARPRIITRSRVNPGARTWTTNPPSVPGVPGIEGLSGAVAIAEPPAVMIGVQMATPDDALRGHLGLKEGQATMLGAIHEGLPASKAGLEPYDLIVGIDSHDEASPEAVRAALKDKKPGDTLKLTVIQKGARKEVTLTLEAYDRVRLDEAKVAAIADRDAFSTWTPNADAFAKGFAGQGENWTRWLREPGAKSFIGVVPGPDGQQQRLLLDDPAASRELADQLREAAEKARAEAERMHEQFMKERGSSMDHMQRQLDEMHRMIQRLIEQKIKDADSKQQDQPAEHRN